MLAMFGEDFRMSNGKVMLFCMTDGSWQKRYGRNSQVGIGGLYGVLSSKFLWASSRVARCSVCAHAYRCGKSSVRYHDCTKNCDGNDAASSMEKSIAVECVNKIYENGAIVKARINSTSAL